MNIQTEAKPVQPAAVPRPEDDLDAALREIAAAAAAQPADADEASDVLASINGYLALARAALSARRGDDDETDAAAVLAHLSEIALTADIIDSGDSIAAIEGALGEIETHVAKAWGLLC